MNWGGYVRSSTIGRPTLPTPASRTDVQSTVLQPEEMDTVIDIDAHDCAIVMSHHLASDRAYLLQLAGSKLAYLGLLGPAERKRRLLSELGEQGDALAARMHGTCRS